MSMTDKASSSTVKVLPSPTPFYRLDDQLRVMPVQEKDFFEDPNIFEEYNWTYQTLLSDGSLVSSVFLGLSVGSMFHDQPLVFETMIFLGDGEPCFQQKHATMEECLAVHYKVTEQREKELALQTLNSHSDF